jgi:hypothetical protein
MAGNWMASCPPVSWMLGLPLGSCTRVQLELIEPSSKSSVRDRVQGAGPPPVLELLEEAALLLEALLLEEEALLEEALLEEALLEEETLLLEEAPPAPGSVTRGS